MGFYTESAKQLINPVSIPDFLMECAHIDRVLFEGMIELDFAEIYNESGNIVLTEGDEEAAKAAADDAQKNGIRKLWNGFLEALRGVYSRLKGALDKFFGEIASIVSTKVIASDKIKEAKGEFVWYGDYFKKVQELVNLSACDDYLTTLSNYATDKLSGKEVSMDDVEAKSKEAKEKIESYAKYAADGAEGEFVIEKRQISSITDQELKDLQRDLSPAGIAKYVGIVFDKLKTPDNVLKAVEKEASKEDKKASADYNKIIRHCSFDVKLAIMATTGKCITKALKLAKGNYDALKTIAKASEGNAAENKASEEKVGEAVFFATQLSDLFCESVFEF